MSLPGRHVDFKTSSSSGEINIKAEKKSPIFNNDLTSNKLQDNLLSTFSPEKTPMQLNMIRQKLEIKLANSFASFPTDIKSKKSTYKPCPKSKKKNMQSASFNDEEKNLDDDLLGLVESINTDKILDSDSSEEECVVEFTDSIVLPPGSPSHFYHDTDTFKEEKISTTSFFNNSLKSQASTSESKNHTFTIEKKKEVASSTVPIFKEISPSHFSEKPPTSSTIISNSLATKNNDSTFSAYLTGAKKQKINEVVINASKVGTSIQNPITNGLSVASNMCQNKKTLNYQAFYASMGLDEDLCDTEQISNKIPNSVPKEITLSPNKLDNLSNIKIKTEKMSPDECRLHKKINHNKDENVTLDGFHVSMLFEAEPPCEEDEEEVPLLLLKTSKSADIINSQMNLESIVLNSNKTNITVDKKISDFHPPLFIKKEPIESEIASESPSVSSNNSNIKNNASTNSLFVIKSEPIDLEYFSESNPSTSFQPSESQLYVCNSELTEKTTKRKQKQKLNVSKPASIAGHSNQNSLLAKLLQGENSSLISNTHSSCTEPVIKKSEKNRKKKKQAKTKTANVTAEFENSFTSHVSETEMSKISPISDSNDTTSNHSNNLQLDNLGTPCKEKFSTSEETVKNKDQTEIIVEANSKKSNFEGILQPTSNSETSNNTTLEIEDESTTDFDTSIIETGSKKNSSKKRKRKKETKEKNEKLDENIPITLLIKRQKTDSDTPGPFLCTSNTYTVGSNTACDKNDLDMNHESALCNRTDDNILPPEMSVTPKSSKKKKTGKKKPAKKKAKQNIPSCITENEAASADIFSSTPIKDPESNSSFLIDLKESFCKKNKAAKRKNSSACSESESVGKLTDVSLQDNVAFTSSCMQNEESLSSNSFQASLSEDMPLQPEKNNLSSLPVLPKKKKRRPRSNFWYKKKKNRKEEPRKKVTPIEKDAIQNSDPVKINDPLLLTPIVLVKNLNSEYHKVINNYVKITDNTSEIQNTQSNSVTNDNESPENASITTASKTKKKAKGNKSRKKPRSKASLLNKLQSGKEETSISQSDNISNNGNIEADCLEIESSNASEVNLENNSFKNTINTSNASSNASEVNLENNSFKNTINTSNASSSSVKHTTVEHLSDNDEVIITGSNESLVNSSLISNRRENHEVTITRSSENLVDSSLISNRRGTSFPSLDVLQIAKEIATLGSLLGEESNCGINSKILVKNRFKSAAKSVEMSNIDDSISIIEDRSKNLSASSVDNSINSQNISNNTLLQSLINVSIKKELITNSSNHFANQASTSQLNPLETAVLGMTSNIDKTSRQSLSSLVSMKTENNVESQSSHKDINSINFASNRNGDQTDRLNLVENADKINSVPNSVSSSPLSIPNNSCPLDIDKIGLLIKKEVTHQKKPVWSNTHLFRDQNDLIQQAQASTSVSSSLNLCTSNSEINSLENDHSDSQSDYSLSESQKKPLELLNLDDDIQIIPREDTLKDVLLIDLADDDDENGGKISEYDAITNISSEFIELSKRIKVENDNSKTSTVTPEAHEIKQALDSSSETSTFSFLKCNETQKLVDSSKVRTDVSDSNFHSTESCVSEDPIKRETDNPFIVRDKYIDAYFKHPFPATLVSHKNRRKKSKIYERTDLKTWNLPLEEVESRLKHSETTVPQFGKKLGDIVKLEKYPVSKSEVECYHRILGVAPSQKLLLKCSRNQNYLTALNEEFSNTEPPKQEIKDSTNLTANDILQGIEESMQMFGNFDGKKDVAVYDRNCPSTETRDSFESSISHLTDKCVNTFIDKNAEQLSSASVTKNTPFRDATNAFSDSSLTCFSNFEDASNNAVNNNIDASVNTLSNSDASSVIQSKEVSNFSYLQNNVLAGLNLPSKEVVNNILSSTGSNNSSTYIPDIPPNSGIESNILTQNTSVNDEMPLPSSYSYSESRESPGLNRNVPPNLIDTSKTFDLFNLPVVELRKIIQTANSLPSAGNDNNSLQIQSDIANKASFASDINCDNFNSKVVNHVGIWKNKQTYEYNHTQSIPVTNADLSKNLETQKVNDVFSETARNVEEQIMKENSDDEYVDNEPALYDSDNERSDSSSHSDKREPEEPPLPQYKSKWEKIMERKSQELEKEKISELYFKECVPVSSCIKLQNKRNSVSNKVSESNEEKSSKPESNLKSKVEKNSKDVKIQQTGSKKNKESEIKKVNKSEKMLKKVEKQKSKANEPESAKKQSPAKKIKSKKTDEATNLFKPDKLVKNSPVKKPITTARSKEKTDSKRFYGNRVTNRGTFLTETNPSKSLTQIKIPKKKPLEEKRKPANVRSEEFHSMVKSPDIDIYQSRGSSGKNYNKNYNRNYNRSMDARRNSEEYKSPLSDTSPSVTSHFIRNKRMRDRQNPYYNSRSRFTEKDNSYTKKSALLPTPYSSSYLNDETVPHRSPLLQTPSTSFNENTMGGKTPLISSPPSTISSLPPDPFQSTINPSKAILQEIMSVFKGNTNVTSEINSNMLPNSENIDGPWINSLYNSSYGVAEPAVVQNTIPQSNDPVMVSNNPFRNMPQIDLSRGVAVSQSHVSLPLNSAIPTNTLAESLDPRRAALGLQSNMSLNPMISGSATLADTLDPRRAALGLPSNMPVVNASPADPRRNLLLSQPNKSVESLIPMNSSYIPIAESLDPRKAALGMHQAAGTSKKHIESPLNIGSQILNPSPCIVSTSQQVSRKATCLVPSHLKALVGRETLETHNVRLLMLEWSVDWLTQQQKMHDPPPISNALKKVTSSYDSFEDYYNTYFPLMLLETWHRIYVSWTHLNQTAPFSCQINSYSVKNHFVSVECQTLFSTDNRRKGIFPDEGSILMVKYSTKSNEYTIRILGYVTQVKTRRYNPVTDSKICSSLPSSKDVNPDSLNILTLTFMGAYNSEDIEKRQPVRIHVLCTVKHNLKQNDAMLSINRSPLQRSILNPVADGLLTVSLTPRNSPEEKVNECVRDITKGILSPHPLPLLTVVRAKPESDRLNIIPLLIQKMKTVYKTKVLLCVRTVRALGDIAANICLQQSLKLVIINKRCDTNLQFQKHLLDELVSCEIKKLEEENGEKNVKSDIHAHNKIKKQIIRDCDVILSLIRNSHDDFLSETFHETDSIAQMCCIVDEANLCTEPETLIPILHGISKLILIGDPDYTAKVLSKTASAYDFNQSFFQRAYDLDLLTE